MHQLLQAVGTTPVGPLSPLFLDLRPTSIKRHPTLGTAHHPRRPGFLFSRGGGGGGEWTNYIGLLSSSIQILDHFSMATPSPQQCLVLQHFLPPLCDPGVLDHPSMGTSLPPAVFPGLGAHPNPPVGPESVTH